MLSLGTRRKASAKKRTWPVVLPLAFIIAVLILVGGYVLTVALLPAPAPTISQKVKSNKIDTGKENQLTWPASHQAAIGAVDNDVIIVSYPKEEARPIASVAKIITALAVLDKKPLDKDQQGPNITLTADDVALYNSLKKDGGSVVKVAAGEQISQYQALQAMLIPSANNMAVALAKWAFGSEAEYVKYANQMTAQLGMGTTKVEDASGVSPKTVSTARDLVLLAKEALKNPVIAQIVAQKEATIPVAGKVQTTNAILGEAGINGMKTGSTIEAGGCFLFTAFHEAEGKKATVIGALVGSPSKEDALAAAPYVVQQTLANLVSVTALTDGMTVATMQVPWASPQVIVAENGLSQLVWGGADAELQLNFTPSYEAGQVGTARLQGATTKLMLRNTLPQPDLWWRLTHPQELVAALDDSQ